MQQTMYSPSTLRLTQCAERLFTPLVRQGVYDTFERALRSILVDYVDQQIAKWTSRVSEFEKKYPQSFEAFSALVKNRATPEQEEVWMDWEAALVFLKKWRQIRAQVVGDDSA